MRIVDQVLEWFDGNHQRMADAAGVSRQAIYRWFMPDMGYVPNREPALRLAEALLRRGHIVSAARLMALDGASSNGDGGNHRRKGRPFQKQERIPSVVQAVHGRQSTVGEVASVERQRQLRVAMIQCAAHVRQRLAAA